MARLIPSYYVSSIIINNGEEMSGFYGGGVHNTAEDVEIK